MTFKPLHVSVSIDRTADEVYEFVSNPENLPRWAAGLGDSIKYVNGEWIAESPYGDIKVEFVEQNSLGVLDHFITLQSGETFYNPMRVFPNGEGSELIFTIFHRPGYSEEEIAADAEAIKKDLATVKGLLEND